MTFQVDRSWEASAAKNFKAIDVVRPLFSIYRALFCGQIFPKPWGS
jgi:hypothetical protein